MTRAADEQNRVIAELENASIVSMHNQSVPVLEEVRWQVRAGDYWVIAGLQGSGKTDLLMTLAGLLPHERGTYRLFGESMPIFEEARMQTRMRVGLVFDGGQLFNHLTVRENISLPLRYHRNCYSYEVAEEVNQLMQKLELDPMADATPGGLGRNWQKRVGLARALSLRPELLLVDSPLAGLDLRHMNWWLGFLDSLAQGRCGLGLPPMTIIATAADLRPWKAHARQFAILRDHRFVGLGSWEQLEAASRQLLADLIGEQLALGENH